jgi:YgiT-type zinc finger domain-containing protein
MKCPYCKTPMVETEIDYLVEIENGEQLRLEGVPSWVCEACDYTAVEDEVIEAVEDMLAHLDTVAGDDGGEEE